jgi:hypothetical protein
VGRIDVDINQPEFLPVEVTVLHNLIEKHEQYLAQGRDLEARGVYRAVEIVFNTLKGTFDQPQQTNWSEL